MVGPAQGRHPAAVPAPSLILAELGANSPRPTPSLSDTEVGVRLPLKPVHCETPYLALGSFKKAPASETDTPWVKGEWTVPLALFETEENTPKM